MATEIERKFLVADLQQALAGALSSSRIRQGYLSVNPDATVRVRIRADRAFLTVKNRTRGCTRGEWEYEIPPADAEELLALSVTPVIDKVRHLVDFGAHRWEVDVFAAPLYPPLAEVELASPSESLVLPPWLGPEVTSDPRYFNSNIASLNK